MVSHPSSFLLVTLSLLLRLCNSLGPVLTSNFPDPSVIRVDDQYYGFATRTRNVHVQVAEASDFASWELKRGYDAMPTLPDWVHQNLPEIWSPDVNRLPDGSFVLYFAGASRQKLPHHYGRQHCIGAALSKNVLGPYEPLQKPLSCNLKVGGAIDPNGFYDPISENQYLVYKVDGNSLGRDGSCSKDIAPTPILLQQVENNGVSLIGLPLELLLNSRYDGPSIEAPALVFHDGNYYLIHNSRCFAKEAYTVHYAVSYDGIKGPYHKAPRPLLETSQMVNGVELHAPGGVDVDPSNSSRIVFHSDTNLDWFALKVFSPAGRTRAMFTAELDFDAGGLLTANTFRD